MKSLEKILEQSPTGFVFASTIGDHVVDGYRDFLDLDEPIAMSYDDSFDLASITKLMCTTAIIMDLVALGELSISDHVHRYLPAWKGDKSEITIEHLLRHRSGLGRWRPLYIRHKSPESVYEFIAREPLANPVDSVRAYSDLGFITLGQIISTVTQKKLVDLFTEMIAQPYGLTQTQFAKPLTQPVSTSRGDRIEFEMVETNTPFEVPEMVDEFSGWRKHILKGEVSDGNAFHLFGGISSHAGLFSTARDVLSFGEEISQHELFPLFTSDGPDEEGHLGFVGWTDTVDGCTDRFVGHTGFTGTALGISKVHGTVATLLTNRTHTDGVITPTPEIWSPLLHELHAHLHSR